MSANIVKLLETGGSFCIICMTKVMMVKGMTANRIRIRNEIYGKPIHQNHMPRDVIQVELKLTDGKVRLKLTSSDSCRLSPTLIHLLPVSFLFTF